MGDDDDDDDDDDDTDDDNDNGGGGRDNNGTNFSAVTRYMQWTESVGREKPLWSDFDPRAHDPSCRCLHERDGGWSYYVAEGRMRRIRSRCDSPMERIRLPRGLFDVRFCR